MWLANEFSGDIQKVDHGFTLFFISSKNEINR